MKIFHYQTCLCCGEKTLISPNGFCRKCSLNMKLKEIVQLRNLKNTWKWRIVRFEYEKIRVT
jgi:hypothetical protein